MNRTPLNTKSHVSNSAGPLTFDTQRRRGHFYTGVSPSSDVIEANFFSEKRQKSTLISELVLYQPRIIKDNTNFGNITYNVRTDETPINNMSGVLPILPALLINNNNINNSFTCWHKVLGKGLSWLFWPQSQLLILSTPEEINAKVNPEQILKPERKDIRNAAKYFILHVNISASSLL